MFVSTNFLSLPTHRFIVTDVPSAVNDVTVSDVTSTSCKLRWERPSDDGGSRIDGYLVERDEEGRNEWLEVRHRVTSPLYKLTVKG